MSKTLILFFSSFFTFSLFSATFTVDNNSDSGAGSLRQAILDSNTAGGSNTININSGLGVIILQSSLPIITNQTTIVGPAIPQVLNANGSYRAFFFYDPGTTLSSINISNMTINNAQVTGGSGSQNSPLAGGGGAGLGGAVFVPPGATITLDNVSFNSNTAHGGIGGHGTPSSPYYSVGLGGGGGIFGNGGDGTAMYNGGIMTFGGGGGLQGNGGNASDSPVAAVEAGAGGGGFIGNGGDNPSFGLPSGGGPNGGAGGCPGGDGGIGGGGGGTAYCSGGNGGDGGGGGGGDNGGRSGPASNGGFGGGGGGAAFQESAFGNRCGGGGFGGGGGGLGGAVSGVLSGGFGGGAGASTSSTVAGFGGGNSGGWNSAHTAGGGGGGAGLGGALFIYNTSSAILVDPSFSGNTAIGGTAGTPNGHPGSGIGQDIFLMSGGTLELNISGTLVFPSVIESDQGAGGGSGGGVIKSGVGTLDFSTLIEANTYTGGTTINDGNLIIASDSNLGASSGSVTLGNGTLEIATNSFTISRTTTLTGNATITTDVLVTTTWAGGITSIGSLTKDGPGTLILSGPNSYLGTTTVSSGILRANTINTFSSQSTGFIVSSTLDLNSFNQSITQLSGSGSVLLGSATLTTGSGNTSSIFSGMISGTTGSLTKVGTGVFTLSGSGTYSGTTTVSGGTLQAGAANSFSPNSAFTVNATLDLNGLDQTIAGLSGAGTVTLEAGTLTISNNNNPSTFQGMIQGTTGGLTKDGTGTFTLAGTSTYSGTTIVSGGTLQAGAVNAFSPNSAMTVNAALSLNGLNQSIANLNGSGMVLLGAGTLIFGSDNNPSAFSGSISGTGGLIKVGTGIFTLSGLDNVYSGITIVAAGTFQAGATNAFSPYSLVAINGTLDLNNFNQSIANLIGPGLVTLGSGTLTLGSDNNSLTFQGMIQGTGGLTKTGTGTFTLTGSNTYTGTTTVAQGALAVNGSITSNISILANALLQGIGTITGNVTNSGTIAPGNSIGTITIVGNTMFNAGSSLQIEFDPSSTDLLNVTGNVTILPGATLELFPTPSGSYGDGSQFTIVNGSSVTGTFSSVTNSFLLLHPTVLYFPTHIDLALNVNHFADFVTGNAFQIAKSLIGINPALGTDLFFVFQQLFSLDAAQLNQAFNEMQPSLLTGLSINQQNNFVLVSAALRKRTNTLHEMTCAAQKREHPWSIWGDVSGGFFHQEHQDDQVGFHSDNIVGALGIDCVFLKHLYVGVLGAYTYTDIDWSKSLADGHINSYYGGAYTSWLNNLFYVNLSIIGAYNKYHNSRKISFAAIDRHAKANHHGDSITGHVDLGFMVPKGENFQFYPFGQLDYMYTHQARYREYGAQSLDLVMDESSATMLRSEVGIGGRYCIPAGKNYVVPSVKLSWVNEARFKGKHLTARLIDVPNQFTVSGIYPTRNLIAPGATLMGSFLNDALNISLSYEGEYSKKTDYNTVNLSFIWNY